MAHASWLKGAQPGRGGGREGGRRPRVSWPDSYRLINVSCDYISSVLGIRHYPRIPITTLAPAHPLGDTSGDLQVLHKGYGQILVLGSVGVWPFFTLNFNKRCAQKLCRVLLLRFGLGTFRSHLPKTKKSQCSCFRT